ncbi:hypothetical protein IIA79_06320 [bacterium]|nr:hypothetical protein [bacterium]
MQLYLAVLLTAVLVLALPATMAVASSDYLALSAVEPEDVESVRRFYVLEDMPHIAVWGGKPFFIKVQSSYPVEPSHLYIAISDGQLYSLTDSTLEYNCKYYPAYYGLVLAVYPNDRFEVLAFLMYSGWRPEDRDLVPEEMPEAKKPFTDDEQLQSLIDEWWETVVVPKERAKGRLPGDAESDDGKEADDAQPEQE